MNLSTAPNFRYDRRRHPLYRVASLVTDIAASIGALFFYAVMRDGEVHTDYVLLAIIVTLLQLAVFSSLRINSPRLTRLDLLIALVQGWFIMTLLLMLIGFATKSSDDYSRIVILSWIPSSLLLQYGMSLLLQSALINGQRSGKKSRVLIVGSGEISRRLTHYLLTETEHALEVVGAVAADAEEAKNWTLDNAPIIGDVEHLCELVAQHQVNTVYLALNTSHEHLVRALYLQLIDRRVDIHWAPDISGMMLINPNLKSLGGLPVLSLSETPLVGDHARIKRLFDLTLASMILLVATPVMFAAALAIKATSPGPVIFRQRRYGWNGEEFDIMKFRSMRMHTEENGAVTAATKSDTRITPVGWFIRRTSVDELPQLFNVMQGSMSLVGPRPHATVHDDYYSQRIASYFTRLKIKPGITGLAQVNGFRGEITSVEEMKVRVSHDLDYINNWSLGLDLKILFKTVFVLASNKTY
ncbi:MAG: undecaprenyl-phosphate glucose phosphotransferase [Nitrospinae bacterium]|nr:undecaprenyl-phosphate glucose phosphotransferase [Nitrospinota bacterium]